MEISVMPDKESAKAGATARLNDSLSAAKKSGKPVLLLLSGGSSLDLLERTEADTLDPAITITVLDERYSNDPQENNFAQIAATSFYKKAVSKGAGFIDTRVRNGESQNELAERFNKSLVEWFTKNPEGIVITTAGIGPDGHTSGIMPYPENPKRFKELFDNGDEGQLVTSYDATGKNLYPKRITTNINLLRKVDTAAIFAAGSGKREAIGRVQSNTGNLAETPARIWKEIVGETYLFTDIHI